jgi:hypothetical protein
MVNTVDVVARRGTPRKTFMDGIENGLREARDYIKPTPPSTLILLGYADAGGYGCRRTRLRRVGEESTPKSRRWRDGESIDPLPK